MAGLVVKKLRSLVSKDPDDEAVSVGSRFTKDTREDKSVPRMSDGSEGGP
jgi:hypothetical protein